MATVKKEVISEVMELTRQELCQVGMRKRAGDIYTIELDSKAIGWLGLNRAVRNYGELLAINPVVGVRHQLLEQLVARFCGDKYHSYCPATISTNVGYLMPQKSYTTWLFSENEDYTLKIREMVQAVEGYGIPFMRKHTSVDNLIEAMLPSNYGVQDMNIYRLPVAFFMLNDLDSSKSFLLKQLKQMEDREDLASQKYRKFSEKLLEELKETIKAKL